MRIRKRFLVDQSSSSSSSSRRSDPQLRRPSDPPFDHIMAIRSIIKTWLLFPQDKKLVIDDDDDDETYKVDDENKTIAHNIRSAITVSSLADSAVINNNRNTVIHEPSSSSAAAQGSWGEGDNDELVDALKGKKEITLHGTTGGIKLKCDDIIQFEVSESTSSGGKKIKRGNVIMEGSRCSRVNGRGWRCCQPTLVGYSLCEHHLGKGRLRTNARRVEITKTSFGSEDRKLLPLGVTKKRTKIVKARSLNSLLGQI